MSRKATKIFEKMKQTQANWHPHDFQTLYLGYGYKMIEGKKHHIFIHPDFPQLEKATIPRHNEELSKAYARDAVENIETLLRLKAEKEQGDE